MTLARTLLLRASRSEWLAGQFKKHEFTRRAVKSFLPGEELGAALDAAAGLATEGLGSVITNLGERVTTRGEAAAVREHYLGALDAIQARALPTQLSVKLTHLGLDAGRDACASDVAKLAGHAATVGSFVWIDMEESHYVDATLAIFREIRASHANVGLCLQAYLHRTPMDIETLLALQPSIRLVKGAYREPAARALTRRHDIDAAYLSMGRRLLDQAARRAGMPVFGTHDTRLIEALRMHASGRRLPPHAYEVHMLYGIATATQRALATAGTRVRTLISYGTNWFPWYMRRLAERPANMWFVVRNVFRQ
ncbi:MAG TPA: proline dehydrogenase family protein [Gemmatimonadaceae bacterium]|nr:proline dehydrogenase family protein [Gemmatimonadaceae bacterium]